MVKKLIALGFSGFLLSGCMAGTVTDVRYLDGPDGKKVLCAFNSDNGMDCNWDEYNKR